MNINIQILPINETIHRISTHVKAVRFTHRYVRRVVVPIKSPYGIFAKTGDYLLVNTNQMATTTNNCSMWIDNGELAGTRRLSWIKCLKRQNQAVRLFSDLTRHCFNAL